MRLTAKTVFVVFLLLCLVQAACYYPLMPERVASHFGASGRPDAWSGKDTFIGLYLITVAVVAVLFLTLRVVLRKVPVSMINLPNRDFWLHPKRIQTTINDLEHRVLWFGSATLLLLLDVFHQSFRVHTGKARVLEHPATSIVVYLGFTLLWIVGLIVRFTRRPEDP